MVLMIVRMKDVKVAIAVDSVMTYGGAEKILDIFLEMFPRADLYTLYLTPTSKRKISEKFAGVRIHTSLFQILVRHDFVNKYISLIKFLSWIYWELVNLDDYDLVISSSHSYMAKNVKKGRGAFHLSYIHTPPRYLYDEYCELNFIKRIPFNLLFWPFNRILRVIDLIGSRRPDVILVNSENVKKRVEKYYSRQSEVLYPPVDDMLGNKIMLQNRADYYVCLSRLVKQKGIELAVKTCSKYNLPLYVIGNGDEYNNLRKLAGPGVKFVNDCDDWKKREILAKAKALIYTSIDEDFGIVPVEALSCGTPVIAYGSGGVKESVIDGFNGVFFNDFSEDSLMEAIDRFNHLGIKSINCVGSVKKYSLKKFKYRVGKIIEEGLSFRER